MNRSGRSGPSHGAGRMAMFYALAFLMMSVLALLGLELIARMFDPIGVSYYPETARYMDTLIVEDPIGYRNRPGLEGRFYGAPVRINSLGMRDREVSLDAPAGEFRVAILGDSFPFGIGVRYEDSIPAMVERALQDDAPPGTRFRTLNFGVPSYNTEQELIQFDELGMRLHPRAVALLFALNDIYPKKWIFEKRNRAITNLAQRSYAVSLLFSTYKLALAARSDPRAIAGLEDYTADNPRWLAIDRSLTALNGRCRAAGIPFVVLPADDLELADVTMVRAVGEREGFPVRVLAPWRDPRWAGLDPRKFANSKVDAHPNPAGCRIYGRLIADELRRVGAVPGRSAVQPRSANE